MCTLFNTKQGQMLIMPMQISECSFFWYKLANHITNLNSPKLCLFVSQYSTVLIVGPTVIEIHLQYYKVQQQWSFGGPECEMPVPFLMI